MESTYLPPFLPLGHYTIGSGGRSQPSPLLVSLPITKGGIVRDPSAILANEIEGESTEKFLREISTLRNQEEIISCFPSFNHVGCDACTAMAIG
jgi:hypothetical protein